MRILPRKKKETETKSVAEIEAMYDRFAPKFLGLCYRYCGNREDAEDIMHEGFLLILKNIHRFRSRGEGSMEAWMTRIMVTTSLKYLRDHAKYRNNMVFGDMEEKINIPDEEDDHPYPELSEEQLLQMITALPLGYRTVFNFYVMDNYSHKEIADILRISENTSKTQLAKARIWLRKHILELQKRNNHGQKVS